MDLTDIFWQAVIAFAVCALAQAIGHKIEGRAPSVMDSFSQTFVIPPLFVLLEIAFMHGYRREFYRKCLRKIDANIAAYRMKSGRCRHGHQRSRSRRDCRRTKHVAKI